MFAGEGERSEEKLAHKDRTGGSVKDARDGQHVGRLVEAADVLANVRNEPLAVRSRLGCAENNFA